MSWPDDADGDVFRRLEEHGFDFSKSCVVDYNVDFEDWPPPQEAVQALRSMFGAVEVVEPDDERGGYVRFEIRGQVSYEKVTSIQRSVSTSMEPFGGVCESWGVLH